VVVQVVAALVAKVVAVVAATQAAFSCCLWLNVLSLYLK
jgi:hypothetical protein